MRGIFADAHFGKLWHSNRMMVHLCMTLYAHFHFNDLVLDFENACTRLILVFFSAVAVELEGKVLINVA